MLPKPWRLPRRLPYNIAMEMFFLGRRMTAREAAHYGLINKVVPAAELMPAARDWAGRLSQAAPLALQSVKEVLRKIEARSDLKFRFTEAPAGANHYRETGKSMPDSTIRLCEEADAILLGACGLPSVRYPDNTEIMPQVELRFHFDLYAGVRPARLIPGVPSPIVGADQKGIDMVVIRESTEGLFASMGKGVVTHEDARETLVITRKTSERLFEFSFRLAERRKKLPEFQAKNRRPIDRAFMHSIFDRDHPGAAEERVIDIFADEVLKLDSSVPVYDLKTLEEQFDETLSTERLIAFLSTVFGLLATVLAALGLYGVMAFLVTRRALEIGLRMALGAPRSSVPVGPAKVTSWLLSTAASNSSLPWPPTLSPPVPSPLFRALLKSMRPPSALTVAASVPATMVLPAYWV